MSEIHTAQNVNKPISNDVISSSIVLQSNDMEINTFVQQIGKELTITNEHDNTIVTHLIDYIDVLQSDKSNLIEFTSKVSEDIIRLKEQLSLFTKENISLRKQDKLHAQVLLEHKEDFMEALTTQNSLGLVDNSSNKSDVAYSLENILDKTEINLVQNIMHNQTLENYNEEIATHMQELKLVETQISASKAELETLKTQLVTVKTLESENTKLKSEVIESRELNFKEISKNQETIRDQRQLISSQIEMIQLREDDISRLENIVYDMNSQLNNSSQNTDELIEKLKLQEIEVAKAKLKREQSTSEFVFKFSKMTSLQMQPINEGSLFSPLSVGSDGNTGGSASPVGNGTSTQLSPSDDNFTEWRWSNNGPGMGAGTIDFWGAGAHTGTANTTIVTNHSGDTNTNAMLQLRQQIDELLTQLNEKEIELKKLVKQLTVEENLTNKLNSKISQFLEEIDELNEEILELKQPPVTNGTVMYINKYNKSTDGLLSNGRTENIHLSANDKQMTGCVMFGLKIW